MIAIVGRGCALPGALDPQSLLRLSDRGEVAIGPVPEGRWRLSRERVLSSGPAPDRAWSDRGGYVRGLEGVFDPTGFALDVELVRSLDPLFHFVLHAGREALREARMLGERRRSACILGNLSFPTASHAAFAERVWLGEHARAPAASPLERFHSGLPATLLSKALGLDDAGSLCLDAACASSLYAIALACDALTDRRCDVALAGAVNCTDDLFIHVGFCALDALSKRGRSSPFSVEADGLVPAEGAAIVALMRHDDALAEGRPVLGVIRGVGLANDGRGKSLLAPAEEGQARAMKIALSKSGLAPEDVSWIEAHATGTPMGDAVEARSTGSVYGRAIGEARGLPMGSLKANLGHAITAAGAAGLLRVLGCFEQGIFPITPGAERPIDELARAGLRVLCEREPWRGPRRAAVSAFGFGGNDAHLIVEAADEARELGRARAAVPPAIGSREPIAIVGIGARVGALGSASELADAVERGASLVREGRARADEVVLPLEGLRSSPRDLESALAQQTLLLSAALEAVPGDLPRERTAVLIGMQCDGEVARWGARWRAPQSGLEPSRAAAVQASLAPPLEASMVLGTMPNIPANRLNRQLDLRGPSYTISADEASGLFAMKIAARDLRAATIDAAVVGAVDLSCEPVHEAALRALGVDDPSGDAAIVLVLERLSDARAKGHAVLALVEDDAQGELLDRHAIVERFGRAHAALGLVGVAMAALRASAKGVSSRVSIETIGGARAELTITPSGEPFRFADPPAGRTLKLPAHPPAVRLDDAFVMEPAPRLALGDDRVVLWPRETVALESPRAELPSHMREGPEQGQPARETPTLESPLRPLPRAGGGANLASPAPSAGGGAPVAAALAQAHATLTARHRAFVDQQDALHRAFLDQQARLRALILGHHGLASTASAVPVPERITAPPAKHVSKKNGSGNGASLRLPQERRFDRAALEVHASGRISALFGSIFEAQDRYAIQVRMPEPPLLLADRVTGLTGEPGTMGKGSVWTETDVTEGAWYLVDGRMPAGLMIEAGQADLFLISWLGADLLNRGARRYRLLGCKLTYHRAPPAPGETLVYDIHVDGHARQGDIGLFFFHYDCHIGGELALSVRGGQAGFFTEEELASSAGVLWSPEEQAIAEGARLDPPAVACAQRAFDARALRAWTEGDAFACFGPGFEAARAHVRSPGTRQERLRLLDRVDSFDPRGGPWKRGYLRATTAIGADGWYFAGHFHNDPCMPGTLMLEGCLEAMAFYLCALGYALDRDGFRFEPVTGEAVPMICRGQVIPTSRELVYELFVEEVHDGPEPTLYADLLCTVDGLKAFHARRMGLRLVPDFPITTPALRSGDRATSSSSSSSSSPSLSPLSASPLPRPPSSSPPIATLDGVRLDQQALLHSAIGRPSLAFGPRYAIFDGLRRAPRLPGPPYHFVSRVEEVAGEPWTKKPGARVVMAYDVPPDAWYFDASASGTMPFAVLLEVALQPCGWLASYAGAVLDKKEDLLFRNLDGEGEVLAEVGRDAGTLRTEATLASLSESGGMTIVSFDVIGRAGREASAHDVYRLRTVFGFFPHRAFDNQAGLPGGDPQLGAAEREGEPTSRGRLRLLDRITCDVDRGTARGERAIDPGEWFFAAHFFQDPVQPGSLGMEAMLEVLRALVLAKYPGASSSAFAHRKHRWKYRGQVRPTDGRIAVTVRIVSDERKSDCVAIDAEASFWVGGKRIYEATLGLDAPLAEPAPRDLPLPVAAGGRGEGSAKPEPAPSEPSEPSELEPVLAWWRARLGVASIAREPLLRALLTRFAGRYDVLDPDALAALRGRSVLYLANHQTAIETLLFAVLAGARGDRPLVTLAKAEHRESWFGRLIASFTRGTREDDLVLYFDRKDPSALPPLLARALDDPRRSLLIHAEGTRAASCRAPLAPFSGVPIDLAIERGVPIVPVRFSGGLPVESSGRKYDFPVGLSTQDVWIGRPLRPEVLAPLPYRERVLCVRAAIEALGPPRELERPNAPSLDRELGARWNGDPETLLDLLSG